MSFQTENENGFEKKFFIQQIHCLTRKCLQYFLTLPREFLYYKCANKNTGLIYSQLCDFFCFPTLYDSWSSPKE